MENKVYIAYGSNLTLPQMRERCPGAQVIGTSVIDGYGLLFREGRTGSYLTIEPKEGASVPVAAWIVTAEDEAALDRYEGYPRLYYKKELTLPIRDVRTGEVRRRSAFVYIMHEDRRPGLPSASYMEACAEGYRSFGFDTGVLEDAVQASREALL